MRVWLACLLLCLTAGCNLTSATETDIPVVTDAPPQVTASPAATIPAGTATQALAATPTQLGVGGNLGCVPRGDWPTTYTIASGDTLVDIAAAVGLTYTELAEGNCLADADNIAVGQQLRLPQPISADPPTGVGTGTYTNAALGIALDLPANWTAQDSGYITLTGPDSNLIEIMYSVADASLTADEAVTECENVGMCLGNREITNRQPFSLPSGISGVRVDFSADLTDGDPGPSVAAFMIVNGRLLVMRTFDDQTAFNTILNTLRTI